MGRKFVRVSLGGVHDEAEIRGHRRTYIGALPGNIIQAIRKAGTRNCVMMLDEIDKLGAGIQGDPSAALLEVLDPEQNSTFRDNYLGVPFDLSRVVFITTANMLDTIPGPLRDRMEIISLAGYTARREAADRAPLSGAAPARGQRPEARAGGDRRRGAARDHPQLHARSGRAQPRARDRQGDAQCRRADRRRAEPARSAYRVEELAEHPGPAAVRERGGDAHQRARRRDRTGLDAGRRRHPVHRGDAHSPGSGKLILTGQLGEVMKESAQAALSLVKNRAAASGIDPGLFEKSDIHIHVPAGAIPRTGPSAGVAMFMALVSLMTDRTVRSDTAMTGEISLRGLVLPVGGIKEKVVAAARWPGITRVMLPARNRRDFEDIPEEVRRELEFVWLERVEEAVAAALEPAQRDTRPAEGEPERAVA